MWYVLHMNGALCYTRPVQEINIVPNITKDASVVLKLSCLSLKFGLHVKCRVQILHRQAEHHHHGRSTQSAQIQGGDMRSQSMIHRQTQCKLCSQPSLMFLSCSTQRRHKNCSFITCLSTLYAS